MTITMNGAYFNNLDQKSGLKTALAQIQGSVTTDYILFSLNVASGTSPDINFGLTGPVLATNGQVAPATGDLLSSVVSAGVAKGHCQWVWLSIGGWGSNAFTNIQNILTAGGAPRSTLIANFGAIVQALGSIKGVGSIGFDMDYEEQGSDLASLVASVTIALNDAFKCPITFCPYQQLPVPDPTRSPWIQALQQVYSQQGTQPVVGFNLQTYAGGALNDPRAWTAAIANASNTGVSDPAAFVWPIVSCDTSASPVSPPSQVIQKMKEWGSQGASLWATASLPYEGNPLAAYGNAITAGITPPPTRR
ncbi:MAG TPA: hypothetical protein VH877_14380 [Polyangia bacterium]|nr:hypothetical protein [Polyangia bacterium]